MYSDYPQNPEYNKTLKEEPSKERRLKLRIIYTLLIVLSVVVTWGITKL